MSTCSLWAGGENAALAPLSGLAQALPTAGLPRSSERPTCVPSPESGAPSVDGWLFCPPTSPTQPSPTLSLRPPPTRPPPTLHLPTFHLLTPLSPSAPPSAAPGIGKEFSRVGCWKDGTRRQKSQTQRTCAWHGVSLLGPWNVPSEAASWSLPCREYLRLQVGCPCLGWGPASQRSSTRLRPQSGR